MPDFSADFNIDPEIIYLNHAAVAPWPMVTADAIKSFTDQNSHLGAANYPQWLKTEQNLKQKLAQLINSPSENNIALVKNTSEALSFVASGLDWQAGDSIVIAREEFPSNRIVWQSLQQQGVTVKLVSLYHDRNNYSPEQNLLNAIDDRTRLLSVSSVQYADGLRMDLQQLGQYCQQHNILFCVDAIQSLGALPIDVQAIHADCIMADGHKWLISPEGLGVFYCRDNLLEQLKPSQFGWHMTEDLYNFDALEWHPARSARKFECGSPNMLGVHALHSSVSLILEHGIDKIAQQVLSNTQYLADRLKQLTDIKIMSSLSRDRLSGIIAFRHRQLSSEAIYQAMMKKNVICAMRHGNIRFSPHFYTSQTIMDKGIDILKDVINELSCT